MSFGFNGDKQNIACLSPVQSEPLYAVFFCIICTPLSSVQILGYCNPYRVVKIELICLYILFFKRLCPWESQAIPDKLEKGLPIYVISIGNDSAYIQKVSFSKKLAIQHPSPQPFLNYYSLAHVQSNYIMWRKKLLRQMAFCCQN